MSEILIRGMKMPKSCEVCKFCLIRQGDSLSGSDIFCLLTEKELNRESINNIKIGDCPLIEVPTHGDLIDRQKLLEHRFEVYDSNEELCEDYIETYHVLEAPTIIEAST